MSTVPEAALPATTGPLWRRIGPFNPLTAVILGIVGYVIGADIVGHTLASGVDAQTATDQNDISFILGLLFGVCGFLIGLGFANYPVSRILGREASLREKEQEGLWRYFTLCTDHKVVGIQYLWGVLLFFLIAGFNAMLIRTQLLRPSEHFVSADRYISLVGLHGTMMMMMSSAIVIGPFGNYFVPIMIGARRMAFPRIEALSFWLVPCAEVVLLAAVGARGFPSGWTGYASLSDQAKLGMDCYLISFGLIAISLMLVGLNMLATTLTMRAPGMTWGRLPIFVWGVIATAILQLLAAPVLLLSMALVLMDRAVGTSFFLAGLGGSPFLYENLFWVFGHPEVYILALPGFALALELVSVFARKPIWGYKLAVAGLLGVTFLSFFVWQHHLFVSGINPALRPFYMLTTELISIPTAFVFLNAMGTLWKAKIHFTVPMLFALALFFNFFIGGASGVFLSDTPSDVSTHGSFFVMAHFHYTIMGGLVFAAFGGIYYWFPKMFGVYLNEAIGKVQFWLFFVFFNLTFFPLFIAGMEGMPRRVSAYAPHLQVINDFVSSAAYVLGFSFLVFVFNVIYSCFFNRQVPATDNPWRSRGLEWQLPTPIPVENFARPPVIQGDPYGYGNPEAVPVANLNPTPAEVTAAGG
ncbi:MAG TPA: cbb3-type cytochrome c oxidase subunit I [Solirubrobacteraceae bacterium]|nr:cbb3-type cytochrome c oxidase subunit I [Solirubrobacteraceae bacterium]